MSHEKVSDKLAGRIALLKQWVATIILDFSVQLDWWISDLSRNVAGRQLKVAQKPFQLYHSPFWWIPSIDATQVFGGRALTTTGMGKVVENVCDSITGGMNQKC